MKSRPWKPYLLVAANTMGSGPKPMILDICIAGVKIFTDKPAKHGRLKNTYKMLKSHTSYAAWDQRTNLAYEMLSDRPSVDKWTTSEGTNAALQRLKELAEEKDYVAPTKFYETVRNSLKSFYRTLPDYENIPVVALQPYELQAATSLERGTKAPLWDSLQEHTAALLWKQTLGNSQMPYQIPSNERVEALAKVLYLSNQT